MIKLKKALYLTLFCSFFWCVLHESFAWDKIVTGLILSIFIVLFYQKVLFSSGLLSYHLPLSVIIFYPCLLLSQIIKSGFQTAKTVVQNQAQPSIVMVPSQLKNEWYQTLVANSISLTPGTVSVDITKDYYIVLWLCPQGNNAHDYYSAIAESFEKLLLKGDSHA